MATQTDKSAPGMAERRQGQVVWDLPLRLFHWALVATLGCSWWTGENGLMDWHRRAGLVVLALVSFRLFWGLFGSATARFSQFLRGPAAVLVYARSLRSGHPAHGVGHNPMGGWSVAALLLTLLIMVVAGLFSVDVDGLESGPLADFISFDSGRIAASIHHACFTVLLTLVALHLLAIASYALVWRRNLVRPMITGRLPDGDPAPPVAVRTPLVPLLVGIALALALAYGAAHGFWLMPPTT